MEFQILTCMQDSTDPVDQLEQLECLHSENTPHPMITHTIYSYKIPSQNKTKSNLQI